MERTLLALRPWYDWRSYRSLVLLVVLSLAVFLWPLIVDIAIALYFRIPAWFRNSLGQATLVALMVVGLRRIWCVESANAWPSSRGPADQAVATAAARWLPWALRLAVASLVFPLMRDPDGLGFADWDFVLDKFEALRKTILIWGQFPWWNPWCRGGFPLAAEPQIGAVSIATPLVLLLGTTIGLRIAAVLCLLVAVEGSYRLAWLWFREPWSATAAALIYGLNGAVIINVAQGYILAMSYCSVPWLVYHTFRIGQRLADGLWLGFWMAFVVMNGIQYLSLYGAVLTVLVWIRALRVQRPDEWSRLLVHTLAALGAFLVLCGWRLATVLLVMRDDLRERITSWDESPFVIFHYLLARPKPDWPRELPGPFHAVYIDLTCYIGPVVLLLFFASMLRGWRWWHTLAIVCAWLAIGSVRWYQPSSWLASWPFFGSAHVVTRWRLIALLGVALAVSSELARWRNSYWAAVRGLAALLVVVIAGDFLSLAHQQFPLAFSVRPEPSFFSGPPVATIVNVRDGLGYPCVTRGYGVIRGYEPMLSYRRDAPTLRRPREDPDYQGEAWTKEGSIEPVYWSPNRLVFQVQPGQELYINQNPGSWWWVNGQPAFPELRCAEMMVPFTIRADEWGRLDLRIHPRGLEAGIGLHVLGCLLLAAAWAGQARLWRRARPTPREKLGEAGLQQAGARP
jgi:hypothetical protein